MPSSSSIKQPLHISSAASPDQLPRVARKQNRHRHGLGGGAPSSAVSEPPLRLADSSVFTRASMSDLLHGPDSGGSSNGKISHGGRAAGRGMSSDPFYIAPTRELLLSQYMVGDKQYQDFLLYGKEYKDDNLPGYDCGGVRVTPKSAAKLCAGWSAVGMIFMLWAGLMIQCQPLYLKGIDYNSGFVKRSSGGGSNANNYNVNGNGNYAGEQVQNQQEANEQYNNYAGQGSASGRRPIRPQASNAFKAAAAYFVTMVFSLICFHNHEQMGDFTTAVLPRWRVLLNVRQNCIVAYHQYQRRHYTDIPDTPSKGAGGRRRRRKKKGDEDGELPLFQSASSETTRRRRVGGGGGGGPGSGSGSGFSGVNDDNDSDMGSLPLHSSSGGKHNKNAAENFTLELWNKVKGGMRSPMSRRRGRDTKTKHV